MANSLPQTLHVCSVLEGSGDSGCVGMPMFGSARVGMMIFGSGRVGMMIFGSGRVGMIFGSGRVGMMMFRALANSYEELAAAWSLVIAVLLCACVVSKEIVVVDWPTVTMGAREQGASGGQATCKTQNALV